MSVLMEDRDGKLIRINSLCVTAVRDNVNPDQDYDVLKLTWK